jgi:transposase-like protein
VSVNFAEPTGHERLVIDPRLACLVTAYGTDGCRRYLEELRWPGGVECPRCTSERLLWLEARGKYHCYTCRYQFRVTAGTLLHDSNLPLWKWLVAVSLMLSVERGLPATQLQKILGGSYKTAWFLEHRIRAAMAPPVTPGAPVGFAGPGRRRATGSPTARATDAVAPPASLAVLQRVLAGPYRKLSTKHLAAYWDELRWRAGHDASPAGFRETVLALLQGDPLTYAALTAPEAVTA